MIAIEGRWSALPTPRVSEAGLERSAECGWRALGAVPGGASPAAGGARVTWTPEHLHVDAVFHGVAPHNRATSLNERTWELGDTFEFFLLLEDFHAYLEIQVTPENQRLQLRWPPDGLTRVRAKRKKIESFFVSDPNWVISRTLINRDEWCTHLAIPAVHCGYRAFGAGQRFRAAVCRYHYPAGHTKPVLSTTAALSGQSFHQPRDWHELVLLSKHAA
jgi:hypothetical protein